MPSFICDLFGLGPFEGNANMSRINNPCTRNWCSLPRTNIMNPELSTWWTAAQSNRGPLPHSICWYPISLPNPLRTCSIWLSDTTLQPNLCACDPTCPYANPCSPTSQSPLLLPFCHQFYVCLPYLQWETLAGSAIGVINDVLVIAVCTKEFIPCIYILWKCSVCYVWMHMKFCCWLFLVSVWRLVPLVWGLEHTLSVACFFQPCFFQPPLFCFCRYISGSLVALSPL